MESKEVSCTGEFCFKAKIVSKIGHMSEYNTIGMQSHNIFDQPNMHVFMFLLGCASFVDGAELAEELNPIGTNLGLHKI
jgi:hypothetical protein